MPKTLSYTQTVDSALQEGIKESGNYRIVPSMSNQRGPAGIYLGKGTGSSIDFHDFREYQPGDDLRRVDWSAYARNNVLSVKLYQEEISPFVEILIDQSRSMAVYEDKIFASVFTASFLVNATRQSEGRPIYIDKSNRHTGKNIEFALSKIEFNEANVDTHLLHSKSVGKPLRFFISDFLFAEDMESFMRNISRNSAALIPIMLLSKNEHSPEFSGAHKLIDCEMSNRWTELDITPSAINEYKARLKNHTASVRRAAQSIAAPFVQLNLPDYSADGNDIAQYIAKALTNSKIVEAV
jgi:hypothetical protein